MSFDEFDFEFNPIDEDVDAYMAEHGMSVEEEREPTQEELEEIEREQEATVYAQYHFLPQHHDCPDLSLELENRITVPFKRVRALMHHSTTELPYDRLVCSWYWPNQKGAYKKEYFHEHHLPGALNALAAEINKESEFLAYPMTNKPEVTVGVAYHDYGGPTAPIDVRLVIRYDVIPEEGNKHGLTFHLVTLQGKPNYGETAGESS